MNVLKRGWHLWAMTILAIAMTRIPLARAVTSTVEFDYNGIRWQTETTARDVAEAVIESFGDYSSLTVLPLPQTPLTGYTRIVINDEEYQTLAAPVANNLRLTVAKIEKDEKEKAEAEAKNKAEVERKKAEAAKPKSVARPTANTTSTSVSEIHSGLATWYRHGEELTTASRDFPKGTKLRVIAVSSGKSVDVVVDDYGPAPWTGNALDLNLPAFEMLAPAGAGKVQIKYYKI
jgi:hypothetical protein